MFFLHGRPKLVFIFDIDDQDIMYLSASKGTYVVDLNLNFSCYLRYSIDSKSELKNKAIFTSYHF